MNPYKQMLLILARDEDYQDYPMVFVNYSVDQDGKERPFISINCNDFFAWGCADAEEIKVEDVAIVAEIQKKYGSNGLAAWAMIRRDALPLKEYQTKYFMDIARAVDKEFIHSNSPILEVEGKI